jgi:UDP-N-acetylmuramoyl-L-alanyl-D-glutamate--2,6-diaminopimelate ligase
MTTPEAPDIQRYLSEMAEAGLRYAVMETSSHSLAQKRVHGLRFAVAVFTNLTPEHLDWHKTFEAYRDAKAILFQGLDADAFAVLNTDDAASQHFADRTRAGKLWYGFDPKADFWAEIRRADLEHVEFELHTPAGKTNVALKMLGRHNVSNAMAAAAAAYAQGVDLDAISRGLAALEGVPGRVDRVDCRQPYAVVIDFAHTHDALEAVLRALRPCVPGRLLVVFGAGGDRDRLKRPRMGEVVSRLADAAWVTSDNPRSEDPMAIIAEIMAGAARPERLRVQPDRRLAIHEAISAARAGDLCLIAGKGHERVQIFRDDAVPFDDREVVMSYFARRAAS